MSAPRAAIIGLEGTVLLADERDFLRDADPWGIILFARNVASPAQLRRLTGDLRDHLGRNVPVMIDQEGGRVQRMRPPHWRDYLPALDQMRRATNPMRAQWIRHRLIAQELHEAGIDVNAAPLADLVEEGTHPVLLNRLYGSEIDLVVEAARQAADGLMAGGVLPILKHIPGYGRARADGHRELPKVAASRAELEARDFAPFRALNDIAMGMTAHVVYTDIDPLAATVSPRVIELIRQEIGFDGLLMTDDAGMDALSGTPAERAADSLAAGCDIVLYGNGEMADRAAVIDACPPLAGRALARAEAALAERRAPDPVDLDALEDELGALLA